jgi:hypothetical protein
MTYGQDERPDQYPRPGYGQQYRPEDQSWQPPYDPRQDQRYTSGPQEAPWQQAPYPQQQDYPQRDQQQYDPRQHQRYTSGPQEAPWQQAPYPQQQDYPQRDQWQPQQTRQDHGQFQPPQRHRRERSRAPLFVGIAAVFAIAGGGTAYALAGHGSTPSPVSSSSPAKPTPAATPDTLSQLKKLVLQPADLPSGWKGAVHQADPTEAAEDASMYKCIGVPNTDSDKIAEADSDDFSLGNATISSSASSYRSQSDLASDITMLHSPKLSSCLGQLLTKGLATSLPAGSKVQQTMFKITPGSAGAPANVVATGTGTFKVELDGQEIPFYMTEAFITGPLIEADVFTLNVNAPVPASVVKPLVATVATRVNKG